MRSDMDRTLIGRCGKFCGECSIYLAAHGGEREAVAALAAELGVKPERISCEGCQGPAESCFNAECGLIACLDERGYRYCAQCAEINDCTKYASVNAKAGGRPKIYSTQLRAWGEERWVRFHLGDAGEEGEAGREGGE